MSANRECALVALAKLNALADGTKGGALPASVGATMAAAYALLDVADAIREQTQALDLGSIRADLDDISHARRAP